MKLGISKVKSNRSGFTLIESLVAVIVANILIFAILPLTVISVATRVQSRRVDLAIAAAREYTDRIKGNRGGKIDPPNQFNTLDIRNSNSLDSIPSPNALPTDSFTQVDTNGNGFSTGDPLDLVIQPIRSKVDCKSAPPPSPPCTPRPNTPQNARIQGYKLVVRVYRADAFNGTSPNAIGCPAPNPANCDRVAGKGSTGYGATFTKGLGAKQRPLAVFQTFIPGESREAYAELCELVGGCQ
jgi:prepilin-type N-terminal cleavage/methylation domain-containing protein